MKVDFRQQYDVTVIGAGIAGISAALAAARRGHKTCLIEKQTLIGGLASSGMIFIYLPLCDGENHQVTFGQAEELLLAGKSYGPYDISGRWGGKGETVDGSVLSEGSGCNSVAAPRDRYACMFTPAGMILKLDAILAEAGVSLWLDTLLCDAVVENGRITDAVVENLSGCGVISSTCFVDASGDAGLIRHAGGKVFTGKNRNSPWFVEYHPGSTSAYTLGKPVIMKTIGQDNPEEEQPAELSGKAVSSFVREAWQITRDYYAKLYAGESNRFTIYPLTLPSMPQYRMTARIDGRATIRTGEYNCHCEDSIGMIGDWRHAGRIWETPYGALLPKELGGVLAAGRCIASDGDAWEAYRVIPAVAMTGEVAGCAASLAVERHQQPDEIPLDILKGQLSKNHFLFHREEILQQEANK